MMTLKERQPKYQEGQYHFQKDGQHHYQCLNLLFGFSLARCNSYSLSLSEESVLFVGNGNARSWSWLVVGEQSAASRSLNRKRSLIVNYQGQ